MSGWGPTRSDAAGASSAAESPFALSAAACSFSSAAARPRLIGPEEGAQHAVAGQAELSQVRFGLAESLLLLEQGDIVRGAADRSAFRRGARHVGTHDGAEQIALRLVAPVQRLHLRTREADQAIAGAQRMVEEGELVIARQRRKPKREPGEVGRHGVAVHAVEAALGDEAAGVQFLVLVGRERRALVRVEAPRLNEPRRELPARLHQEGARPHSRIAHLERQHRLGHGLRADSLEGGRQCMRHDGRGEVARGVMAARAAALVRGLQQRRARGPDLTAGRAALVHHVEEGGAQLVRGARRGDSLLDFRRELAALGVFLEPLEALLARHGGECREIYEHGRAVPLARLDRERGSGGGLGGEAHDRLVHRPDLLHVECAVGQALAAEREHPVEHAQHAAVRHRRHRDGVVGCGLSLQEWEGLGVEQLAAAAAHPAGAVAPVHQTEQGQQLVPSAAALLHGVGVQRLVLEQPRI